MANSLQCLPEGPRPCPRGCTGPCHPALGCSSSGKGTAGGPTTLERSQRPWNPQNGHRVVVWKLLPPQKKGNPRQSGVVASVGTSCLLPGDPGSEHSHQGCKCTAGWHLGSRRGGSSLEQGLPNCPLQIQGCRTGPSLASVDLEHP